MRKGIKRLLLVFVCLAMCFVMTSCDILSLLYGSGDDDIDETSSTAVLEDESSQPMEDKPSGDSIINNIVIEGGTSDVAYAINSSLRSVVSVYCNFEGTLGSSTSAGSGVIYELDGETGSAFIITNYHVVYSSSAKTSNKISDDIFLLLYGMEYTDYAVPAKYVGGSMNYDIAVLYVENSSVLKNAYDRGSVCEATVANSDDIVVGETTIAIGNPEMYGISATTGIVSVDSEHIDMKASDGTTTVSFRVIRTDTAVNSGNSGGGLFNHKGELIGIVNAKISSSDVENIGYAIPSNVARAIADNIIYYCFNKKCETVMRGLLGVTVQTASVYTEYDAEKGIMRKYEQTKIKSVNADGLAYGILKENDIVKSIKIGDKKIEITRQYHLIDAMLDVRVGDTVILEIERNGEAKTVSTTITEGCLAPY